VVLREYKGEAKLIFKTNVESDYEKSYLTVKEIDRMATHILVFKWIPGNYAIPDISKWGKPVYEFKRREFVMAGAKIDVGIAGKYFVVPAIYDEAEKAYYCETRFTKSEVHSETIGDSIRILYLVERNTDFHDSYDKVTVSFAPTRRESDIDVIPYDELFYTVMDARSLRYPISRRMVKKDAFSVYLPKGSGMCISSNETSGITVDEVMK